MLQYECKVTNLKEVKILKRVILSFVLSVMLLTLVGCTSKSYVYSVETGDKIKIELNTEGGYDITSDAPFFISKEERIDDSVYAEDLSQGVFVTLETYNKYISSIGSDSKTQIIESDTKNGLEYTFFVYNDSEWDYIIKIEGSNTGLILGNRVSEESARECFNRLTITKK